MFHFEVTHVRPGVGISVRVANNNDVPVDKILESGVSENLINNPQAGRGSDPFAGVKGAVNPDGLLARSIGDLDGFNVATFGGVGDVDEGNGGWVGFSHFVQVGVDFIDVHEAVVDGHALFAGEFLLQDFMLGTFPLDGTEIYCSLDSLW
jgi:hypothetical protein